MHLDVDRIEERIQKLQEVRRIANDPDLLRMLTEFIVMDAYRPEPVSIPEPAPAPKAAASKAAPAKNEEAAAAVVDPGAATGAEAGRKQGPGGKNRRGRHCQSIDKRGRGRGRRQPL